MSDTKTIDQKVQDRETVAALNRAWFEMLGEEADLIDARDLTAPEEEE